jgi:hypothetical protein
VIRWLVGQSPTTEGFGSSAAAAGGSWRPEALRGFGIKLGQSAVPGVVQVMLARSYAASGRTADARKAYEAAFDLWPDAEPDMPLLVEAKREYAALGS